MGRFLFFIIIIAAILAGVWFFVPGGKDMMQGFMGKTEEAVTDTVDDASDAVDEVVDDSGMTDESDESGDMPPPDGSGDEPSGDTPPAH